MQTRAFVRLFMKEIIVHNERESLKEQNIIEMRFFHIRITDIVQNYLYIDTNFLKTYFVVIITILFYG